MDKKKKAPKSITSQDENKEYLHKIFEMFRAVEYSINVQRHEKYNNTEIRLLNEIVYAVSQGERLISTQLATRLGITRSAVSQIVGKLEKDGAVRRVADEVDKKIAYIELTDEVLATYKEIIEVYANFVGRVVAYMGVAKMDKYLALSDEFSTAVELAIAECKEQKLKK